MIKSMTGYGKAETLINGKKITIEIRSLNSKQLDLSVKMPAIYRQCEYEIRGNAAKKIQRGKTDIYLNYEICDGANTVRINKKSFSDYLSQLGEIGCENGFDVKEPLVRAAVLPAILRLPEVVQNEIAEIPDEELEAIKLTADRALDALDGFRQQEGAILIADLLGRIERIGELKNEIAPYEHKRADTVKNRIRENIENIGIAVDENRLEQEMVFYIEKFDITEEKVRLQNHLDYFRQVAGDEDGAGRKLGFIAQEIGREINTLGSKANDSDIQKLVVQMKDELEKIKEQLLNIL